MKGINFVIEDQVSFAPWRFMIDIDLLVSDSRILDAVDELKTLGYDDGGIDYRPEEVHHYPALFHPDSETMIELHSRLFSPGIRAPLCADDLFRNSVAVDNLGTKILVPSLADRVVHLIAHAQISHDRFGLKTFSLRELLDFNALANQGAVDWPDITERFAQIDCQPHLEGYLAASARLLGPDFLPAQLVSTDNQWADAAIRSLLHPMGNKRRIFGKWFKGKIFALLTSRERRRRAWRVLTQKKRRDYFLSHMLTMWKNIR